MKLLASTLVMLSIPVLAIGLWAYRSRLGYLKNRIGMAIKLLGAVYLASIAYQLINFDMDHYQLKVAAISLAFFAGIWVIAWFITRSMTTKG
ncbi:MAG: hypothetical protein ACOX87_09455 [Chloroflexota bacterium]